MDETDDNFSLFIPVLDKCVATWDALHEAKLRIGEAIEFNYNRMKEEESDILELIQNGYRIVYNLILNHYLITFYVY